MVAPRIGRTKRPKTPAAVQTGEPAAAQTDYQAYVEPAAGAPWADTLNRVREAGWINVPPGFEERAGQVWNYLEINRADDALWSGIASLAIPSVADYQAQVDSGAGIPPDVATVDTSSGMALFTYVPELSKFVSYFFTIAFLFPASGWDVALGWLEQRIAQQEAADATEQQRITGLKTKGGPVFRAALLLQTIKRELKSSAEEGEEANAIINKNLKEIITRRYELVEHMAKNAQQLEQRKDIFRAYIEWEMELASLLYAFGTEADQNSVLEMMRKSRQLITTTNKQTGQTTSKPGDGIIEIWNSLPGRSSGFSGSAELLGAYGDGKPRNPTKETAKRAAAGSNPKSVDKEISSVTSGATVGGSEPKNDKDQVSKELALESLSIASESTPTYNNRDAPPPPPPPLEGSLFELDM